MPPVNERLAHNPRLPRNRAAKRNVYRAGRGSSSAAQPDGVMFRAGLLIELVLDVPGWGSAVLDQKSPGGSGLFGFQLDARLRGK